MRGVSIMELEDRIVAFAARCVKVFAALPVKNVGSADYLWILSRTSGLSETAKSELLYEARRRGYVTDKLILVKQK